MAINTLYVELADTPEKRERGLMYRKEMEKDNGMLFVFGNCEHLGFWMQNTYMPLDIAFVDDNGTVLQIEEMFPLSTRSVISKFPCRYALEVNKGWFKEHGVKCGDKLKNIKFEGSIRKLAQNMAQNNIFTDNAAQNPQTTNENVVSPETQVLINNKQKIEYADQHNLQLIIVYTSEQSGETLPPRKLVKVPNEGYTFGVSKSGEYFTALDISPTIHGNTWVILGDQIKRFLINNIIALEVIDSKQLDQVTNINDLNQQQIIQLIYENVDRSLLDEIYNEGHNGKPLSELNINEWRDMARQFLTDKFVQKWAASKFGFKSIKLS